MQESNPGPSVNEPTLRQPQDHHQISILSVSVFALVAMDSIPSKFYFRDEIVLFQTFDVRRVCADTDCFQKRHGPI